MAHCLSGTLMTTSRVMHYLFTHSNTWPPQLAWTPLISAAIVSELVLRQQRLLWSPRLVNSSSWQVEKCSIFEVHPHTRCPHDAGSYDNCKGHTPHFYPQSLRYIFVVFPVHQFGGNLGEVHPWLSISCNLTVAPAAACFMLNVTSLVLVGTQPHGRDSHTGFVASWHST